MGGKNQWSAEQKERLESGVSGFWSCLVLADSQLWHDKTDGAADTFGYGKDRRKTDAVGNRLPDSYWDGRT